MKYCFDLDETICATPSSRKYDDAVPYIRVIQKINELYNQGNEITIFTARGSTSGIDYRELITSQLSDWGVKFHKLIDKGKPSYDLFVDDKAMGASVWREKEGIRIIGFVASCFDMLHAGHCLYLQEARSVCDYLIAALQEDPTIDRPHKNKPIQSLKERDIQLRSNRYVDEINELHKGKHIRWIRTGTTSLTNGGIVVDIKFKDNGTHIMCKNGMNRFIQYKFDDCITFQKLSTEEQLIMMAYEHAS